LPPHVAADRNAPLPADSSGSYSQLREQMVERFERDFVQNLLSKHHGDVTAAAQAAGLPRGSLYRLLKKLTVDPAQFRDKQ
jgi:DNA-binding NtrC family response regulator